MRKRGIGTAVVLALMLAVSLTRASRATVGPPGLTPVACPDQDWQYSDPTFQALPGARPLFGRYDGGVYRIEFPPHGTETLFCGRTATWITRAIKVRSFGSGFQVGAWKGLFAST